MTETRKHFAEKNARCFFAHKITKDKVKDNGIIRLIQQKVPVENLGKGTIMRLGVGDASESGGTVRYELGQIDVNDTETLMEEMSKQVRTSDVENSIVVDKYGNVFHFKSNTAKSVDMFDVDLDGATVLHNHPESNGTLSFGEDDFMFLRENQNIKSFRCCNTEYDYSVRVINDISELSYHDLYEEAMAIEM